MKYVMGDIHGRYDKFISMLKLIDFNASDTLYVLGDCIDRGDQGIKVLQHIMENQNIDLIWGNHEKLMMDFIESGSSMDRLNWFYNGGSSTNDSFKLLSENEKTKLRSFINSLPYYKIVDKFILCHAGIRMPEDSSEMKVETILESQDFYDLLWIREDFYHRKAVEGYTVIFGHTPSVYIDGNSINENGDLCAWHDKTYGDKICIDCGTAKLHGRLCCIRLEDMQEFYV